MTTATQVEKICNNKKPEDENFSQTCRYFKAKEPDIIDQIRTKKESRGSYKFLTLLQ